jgi:hypothetical protein
VYKKINLQNKNANKTDKTDKTNKTDNTDTENVRNVFVCNWSVICKTVK